VQYTYNNTIFSDTTVSDLGVDVDSSQKYDGHINRIVAKAYSRIGILFRDFSIVIFFFYVKHILDLYWNMHPTFSLHISLNT